MTLTARLRTGRARRGVRRFHRLDVGALGSPLYPHQNDALPAGHWTAERAAADIVTLARRAAPSPPWMR
jgi:hypothetical protein